MKLKIWLSVSLLKEYLKLFVIQLLASLISFYVIIKFEVGIVEVLFIASPVIYLISGLESGVNSNRFQLTIVTYLLAAIFSSYPMVSDIALIKSLTFSLTSIPSSYIYFAILNKKLFKERKKVRG